LRSLHLSKLKESFILNGITIGLIILFLVNVAFPISFPPKTSANALVEDKSSKGYFALSRLSELLRIEGSEGSLMRPITSDYLSSCSILVLTGISSGDLAYSSEEASIIDDWVKGGGNLFLMTHVGCATDLNTVSKYFGLSFNSQKISGVTIGSFSSHYITQNIDRIHYDWGCSFSVSDDWEVFATYSDEPVLAVAEVGKGRIVAVGALIAQDYEIEEYPENCQLVARIMSWFFGLKEHPGGLCFSNFTDVFVKDGVFQASIVYGEKFDQPGSYDMRKLKDAFASLAENSSINFIADTKYSSVDLLKGPLVIIGRPDYNAFLQELNTQDSYPRFVLENGRYYIETIDGHRYQYDEKNGTTWGLIQLIWDNESSRPILLIEGIDRDLEHFSTLMSHIYSWFSRQLNYLLLRKSHSLILKLSPSGINYWKTSIENEF